MRPIRIEMQAFGPYLKRQVLDFRLLGDERVFLIHGPTGAGKTTLFDAMAYALYGRASGDRQAAELRSKHAPAELATEVVFDFALGDALYRARRRLEVREITRGAKKGELEEEATAELLRLAEGGVELREVEAIASQDRKVTSAVIERVGLGAEQFLQVIVLPQGKFRQFLASTSQDREMILQALFKTSEHRRFQDRLDEEAKRLEQRIGQQRSELRGKAGIADSQAIDLTGLESQRAAALEAERDYRLALEPLKSELDRLRLELARERELLKRFADLDEANAALTALEAAHVAAVTRLGAAHGALERARGDELVRVRQEARLERLKVVVLRLAERERIQAACQAEDSARVALGRERELAEKALVELEASLPRLRESEGRLIEQGAALEMLQSARRERENLRADAEALERRVAASAELLARIDKGRAVIAHREQESAAAREELVRLDEAFVSGQAALLAQGLKPGQPCSVCGSIEHPHKATGVATIAGALVDRERVKAAEAVWKQKEDEVNRYRAQLSSLEAQLIAVRDEIGRMEAGLHGRGYAGKEALERELAEGAHKIMRSEKARQELASVRKQLEQGKATELNARAVLKDVQEQQAVRLARAGELQGQLKALNQDLEGETARDAREAAEQSAAVAAEIDRLRRASEAAHDESVAATQLAAAAQASLEAKRGEIAAAESRLGELATESACERGLRPRIEEKLAREAELARACDDRVARIGASGAESARLTALIDEVSRQLGELAKLEEEYGQVHELAQVARGHGGNRFNMSFQRYVQSIYFEEVLRAASYRLEKMSQGRYALKRSEALGKGRISGGLDLVVEDRWQGKERPASTLSGGEGFMASLALALALSQIVQEENGAIRMDAMFVDEGFGTLDEELLGRVIETLTELHGQGRMVGLISHVPELRQVIPARIEVIAGAASGSELRVIV